MYWDGLPGRSKMATSCTFVHTCVFVTLALLTLIAVDRRVEAVVPFITPPPGEGYPRPTEVNGIYYNLFHIPERCRDPRVYTYPTGGIVKDKRALIKRDNPHKIKGNIQIKPEGCLYIEPGCILQFAPGYGLIVNGTLIAWGSPDERITFTNDPDESSGLSAPWPEGARLVDGNTTLDGRLELKYHGKWRGVCTNYQNFTKVDANVTCRSLGFLQGNFTYHSFAKNVSDYVLYERPACAGSENDLLDCPGKSEILMGRHVCDEQQVIGFKCEGLRPDLALDHWRGIEFINSTTTSVIRDDFLTVKTEALSRVEYADISNAGVDIIRDASKGIRHPMATISANPHAPNINEITLTNGAHDGLNFTDILGSVSVANSTISHNRGHGMVIRSTVGRTLVNTTDITHNWGDGIKFHMINYTIVRYEERFLSSKGFCSSNIAGRRLPLFMFQDLRDFYGDSPLPRPCYQTFTTAPGRSITVHFLLFEKDSRASGRLKLYEGYGGPLLQTVEILNGSYPQSISTAGSELHMEFEFSFPKDRICSGYKYCLRFLLEITGELGPDAEFSLINSTVSNNTMHGVNVQDMRCKVFFNRTEVSFNHYEAGIRIFQGAGEVTINNTLLQRNALAGANITYSGGYILMNNTRVLENRGYGVITEYDIVNKTRYEILQKMEVVRGDFRLNEWTAFRIGNYCKTSSILVNESRFAYNFDEGIEFLSCNRSNSQSTNFSLAFNEFNSNQRHSILISPMLYVTGILTNNTFRNHEMGAIRFDNGQDLLINRWYADFPVNYNIFENLFEYNSGRYVASITLTQASPVQKVYFKFNQLIGNNINDTFGWLNPRSRANAVVILSSSGIIFERNRVENPDSVREVATHLTDPSVKIQATRNWWGNTPAGLGVHEHIYNGIFDRDDRYNLAFVEYYPALASNRLYEDYFTDRTPRYQEEFNRGNRLGGVLEGRVFNTDPQVKAYIVDKDIYVRPGAFLNIRPGTTLYFKNTLGMVVYGRLVADGAADSPKVDPVVFAMQEMNITVENVTASVRLEDGYDQYEGRLEVQLDGVWGTVCKEGWVEANAALACQQLGLAYNPQHAVPRRRIIGASNQPVLLADVDCRETDLDLAKCRSVRLVEKSASYCNHSQDVILRCHPPTWSGITMPAVPKGINQYETQIRQAVIRQAGLFDAATMEYSPALRIDYNYHVITNLTVEDGVSDGIDIKFTHPVSENRLESCKVRNNLGSGIVTRDTTLEISYTFVSGSGQAGLRYDPSFTEKEALDIRNSIHPDHRHDMLAQSVLTVGENSMMFLVTNPGTVANGIHDLELDAGLGYRLTLQILDYNPILSRENVTIFDSRVNAMTSDTPRWQIEKDLVDFPITASSRYLTIRIQASGIISGRLTFAAHSRRFSKISRTRLYVRNCTFEGNTKGVVTNHYNNPSNYKQDLFFRHKNEVFEFELVFIKGNIEEAMHIPSVTKYGENDLPSLEEMTRPQKVAVIQYILNYCRITNNGIGIVAEHNHVDFANNVWHWEITFSRITNNFQGGFEMELPRVNDRLERQTHSLYVENTKFTDNKNFAFVINGYYANVTILLNTFKDNVCRLGLVSISGMEKDLVFNQNAITSNVGRYMVDFDMDSHSEYSAVVSGGFYRNTIRNNRPDSSQPVDNQPHTYAFACRGVQNVTANRNIFENINMQYELVAGVTALSLLNEMDVKENWWGYTIQRNVKERIFDFDDWNNFAIAEYKPFLDSPELNAGLIPGSAIDDEIDWNGNIGGRIVKDTTIPEKGEPYIVESDLTVMPNVILKIQPGTEFQFKPNVGILVLGILEARGLPYARVKMGPYKKPSQFNNSRKRRAVSKNVRLVGGLEEGEGFLELYNTTSKSYNLMCDTQFNEKTAEVVCRELNLETINVNVRFTHLYDHYVYGRPMFFRKEFWANSFYCKGNEDNLEQCKKRINYNLLPCVYAANYTFVRCGKRNLDSQYDYWGNIRFAPSSYEEKSNIVDDPNRRRSSIEYADITGAGILHGEKVGSIQATYLAPKAQYLNISVCASNALDYIAPRENMLVSTLNVTNNLGYGLNVLVLNGASNVDSPFQPLVTSSIPYNLFGMVEICRMEKQITIKERLILFYKYSNRKVDCVKIITSESPLNRLAIRFLQINLYNDTFSRNAIEIFNGMTVSDESMLVEITADSDHDAIVRSYTADRTLAVHMHASSGQWTYGFIAEVVTLPQSGSSYPDSSYSHKVENTVFQKNQDGAILYRSVGEVTPSIFLERCWIEDNGVAILNLTSWPAIDFAIHGTRFFNTKNNFVNRNKGGIQIEAETSSVAARANITLTNNVISFTTNGEALNISGHHYNRVYAYENDIINNTAGDWRNVITVKGVQMNFTQNLVTNNYGHHAMAAYIATNVRTQQLYSRNIFSDNNASAEYAATVLAGEGSPKFVDNYLNNPLCDFEFLAGRKVELPGGMLQEGVSLNASNNWWGSYLGPYIRGKIWDETDNPDLKNVIYFPAKADNSSFLEGKCPAGWRKEEERCYRYLGGALNYETARSFCIEQGGYLAETKDRERFLNQVVKTSQADYSEDMKVWVYGSVSPGRCGSLRGFYVVEEEDCVRMMLPFICERDPYIAPPGVAPAILAAAIAGGVAGGALLILIIFITLWCVKSKRREKERFERRESIRSSVRSARSKTTIGGFTDKGTPSQSRARSLDNISDGRRGVFISGVTSAETSTETLDKPRLDDYYFEKSNPSTPDRRVGPGLYKHRTDHYVNGAYYNGGSTDDEKFDEDDEGIDEDGDYEEQEDEEDTASQKTSGTTATSPGSVRYGQAPPPYQFRPPRLENEISSLRRTPDDNKIYTNSSIEDKSLEFSSDRSRSGASLRTFGSHDSMVRPPAYQEKAPITQSASQNSLPHSATSLDQRQPSLPSIKPMYRRREMEEEMTRQRQLSPVPPPHHRSSPAPFHQINRQTPPQEEYRPNPPEPFQSYRNSPSPYQQQQARSSPALHQPHNESPSSYQPYSRKSYQLSSMEPLPLEPLPQSPPSYSAPPPEDTIQYMPPARSSPMLYQEADREPVDYRPSPRSSPTHYQAFERQPATVNIPPARASPLPYQNYNRNSPGPDNTSARHSPAPKQPLETAM